MVTTDEITIREIIEKPAYLFSPSDKFIGEIKTKISLDDVLLQIKNKKLSGYYLIFDNKKSEIDNEGGVANWQYGMFRKGLDILNELIGI